MSLLQIVTVTGVCWGYSLEQKNGFPFMVLKTGQMASVEIHKNKESSSAVTQSWIMECKGNLLLATYNVHLTEELLMLILYLIQRPRVGRRGLLGMLAP